MKDWKVGFAFCGSFCTYDKAMAALEEVRRRWPDVTPIISERSAATDTRFGNAHDFMREMQRICDRRPIDSIRAAEPIGPQKLLDVLVICPCTGNTLAKLAAGVTDSSVTMAAKAHLRNGRPLVIAVATNDGLAASAKNIGALMDKKNIYFVPFRQDDPAGKPTSLVADFGRIPETVEAAMAGRQIQPVLLGSV
ncbi:dipicolinate synthase subunit B [uncultured Pseudoflavonifractor sp.]|uniref:dipicolinate synthase subunit B n=1 Tax=uncultured Pseudoflavonifractor sp. TaxID=1221379 RepID=UPI0025E0AB80|nr:dipicolinate synthase subunit B [uncultured Pseudoflavonifractor sp.]